MKIDFSNIALILFLLFSLQKANGQELNSISVENKNVSTQSEMVLLINITPSDPNFCGVRIEWGDGEGQDFRYEKSTSEPIKFSKIYDRAGDYTVSVKGKYLSRGLKSAVACKGENLTLPIKVAGKEPVKVASKEPANGFLHSSVSCSDWNYYPAVSKRLKEEGIVTLGMAINSKGKVIAAEIKKTSGFKRLDDAALDNIKNCIYTPSIIDNKTVEFIANLNMVFKLEDSGTSIETLRAKRDQYPETPNDKVDEILEARLREATESRLKQEKEASESQAKREKEDAEYQVWLRTSEGKKFLADKAIQEKKEMAGRELEAKKVEEQARQERINFAKKYPFYAIVTCTGGGRQFNTSSCLAGNVESKVKVGNSTSHHLLPILALGKETRAGLVINLLSVFELKFQNSSEMDNLNVKIFNSLTNEVIYFKSTGLYGVIAVKNCIRKTNVKDSKNLPSPKDSIGACDA